ncbi:site-specific integrase [Pseudomonas sp. KU26590]|uniref:tyrosine-type recombinase/integrase n=1 Tax=Pseudomonas sp. KU26590 TaxID=2991051 RepID=UPI00223E6DAD|nr:site-specific integrase [Pseudomonas sp. KU26590]UZJ57999.1 site-specific integrase [Pseudomonas sp. KU26590]
MSQLPRPIFESYEIFIDQDFSSPEPGMVCVRVYLDSFEPAAEAHKGYLATRGFLRSFSENSFTFTSYRTHVERLLLWAMIVKRKPFGHLKRQDAEDYLEFCRNPPADWIGPIVRGRFVSSGHTESTWDDLVMPNDKWRPFSLKSPKAAHHEKESCDKPLVLAVSANYRASQGTINQVYSICSRFFEHLVEDGVVAANPFRMIKKKGQNRSSPQEEGAHRALTPLQWDYVLETAEQMALAEPERHERTLFIVATLFAMYLRVSDLVGRPNWHPVMGDFRQDEEGNWWYHVIGKGNKAGKIAVRDEYIAKYMKRYRRFLGLPELPQWEEQTPLLTTLRGRSGLSGRQVRALLQAVFDNALSRMRDENREEHELISLKAASAHWLRHTAATFDAPLRSAKDLQLDLRHSNLSTTQNVYYHSHDQERSRSVKKIGMRDRG